MNGNGYDGYERTARLVGPSMAVCMAVCATVGVAWLGAMIYVIAAWSTSR